MISDQGARPLDRERTLQRLLSTDDVAEPERFSYWRDMVNQVFVNLRPERTRDGAFFASITTGSLGAVGLAYVRSCAQRVYRTKADIARSPDARYFVNFQLEGESTFSQGGEHVRLLPGDLGMVDSTRPLELGFPSAFCHFTVELPDHFVRSRFADPDRIGGLVVRGSEGIGALVSGYMRSMAALAQGGERVSGEALGDHLLGLLAIAFGATPEAARHSAASLEEARLRSVYDYIERNLAAPGLTPARIATDLKVSTRYLHKLFEGGSETLMQRILRRRLERCRSDLANPAMRARGISEIAYAWGFSDLSHFGRAFRAAFGEAPRDWRRRATSDGVSPS